MIWLLFGVMALAVLAVLLRPLLKPAAQLLDRNAYGRSVFKDQLTEVERDLARGVITAAEAEAARLEIQRRLLAAARTDETSENDDPARRAGLTAAMAVLVPFTALGIYLSLGAPDLPQQQPGPQARDGGSQHTEGDAGDMAALVERLAARVASEPANPEGWALLARSYRQLERYPEAVGAYKRLMELVPNDAIVMAEFGELSTAAAGGLVTAEAHDAFVAALRMERGEPRAQFYLGLELAQKGDAQNAIAVWRALTAAGPEDAPWLSVVREQMAGVAQQAGVMPVNVEPRHALDLLGGETSQDTAAAEAPLDPDGPDVSAVRGRFSPENLAMIQGMVGGLAARLESEPEDFDGWMMLARSYTVLENTEGAAMAYDKAIGLRPEAVTTAMEETLKRDPQQADALFVLGLARAKAGDASAARELWTRAEATAAAPLKAEIARRLNTLK